MEDQNYNQNASYVDPVRQEPTIRQTSNTGVPDNTPRNKDGKGFPKWIIALVGVILILVVGGFFIVNSLGNEESDASPSPTSGGLSTFPTPAATESPTPTPEARDIDKTEVKIEVLNGTGTPGEASFLQGELEDLGYEDIEVANADNQDEEKTTVTFASDLPEELVDEITEALEDIYDEVESQSGSVSGGFDVRILTGPRSGSATASPKATSTAKPTATASPTSSPSN